MIQQWGKNNKNKNSRRNPHFSVFSFMSNSVQALSILTDWFASWGKVWIRWAFHLKGMLGLYTASTRTLSPTWGVFPFTALKRYTSCHENSHQFQTGKNVCIPENQLLLLPNEGLGHEKGRGNTNIIMGCQKVCWNILRKRAGEILMTIPSP